MISIKELHWSHHVRVDREERTMSILMTVGVGEIIACKEDFDGVRQRAFTDTGCILIFNPETKVVITFFLASMDQTTEFFSGQIPPDIRKAVKHSIKIYTKYLARG